MIRHPHRHTPLSRRHIYLGLLTGAALIGSLFAPIRSTAQMTAPIIGHISGGDFSIEQPANAMLPPAAIGTDQPLVSGSRILVKSGNAHIVLEGGGDIFICESGRMQVLTSGASLTLALDYGALDLQLESSRSVAVYTPLIIATPLTVGGGQMETMIGLSQKGDLCLSAIRGAARVEQQLSGQSLLVPQFEQMTLSGGQVTELNSSSAACGCRADIAKARKPQTPSTHLRESVGVVAVHSPTSATLSAPQPAATSDSSRVLEPKSAPVGPQISAPVAPSQAAAPDPREIDAPVYKVLMPPLSFDAKSPGAPPEATPETFVLLRSAHVQNEAIFEGEVALDPKRDRAPKAANAAQMADEAPHGIFHRIGGFFRRIFGG
jgi:hypothetical protein